MGKIRTWRKLGCIFLATACLCSVISLSGGAKEAKEDGTQTGAVLSEKLLTETGAALCAETDALELYLSTQDMTFFVKNKANGYLWHSNPPERADDEYSRGIQKMEMSAWLNINYTRKSTGIEDKVNSYTGSAMDENYKLYDIENGFRIDFRFEDIALTVPMEVQLAGDSLTVRVLTGEMVQDDPDIFVETISVLQYFGAGKMGEEGYLFVPDGCGALIHFDNGKSSAQEYSMPVYGQEPTTYPEQSDLDLDSRKLSLPVFGIKKAGNACLTILEEGAELAEIKANVCRQVTGYANVYAQYRLYGKMDYALAENETEIYENSNPELTSLSLKYRFLTDGDADYSGMARSYREYLKENGMLPEAESVQNTCYLTMHGAVMKKVSWLGFVTDSVVPLTTVSELEQTMAALREQGVDNIVINYVDWNQQELSGKQVTGVGMAGKLGSIKELQALQKENQTIYATLSSVLRHRKQGFFGRFTDLACDISGMELRLYEYSAGLGLPDKDRRYYLLTASKLADRAADLAKAAGKQELPLGLDDMGNLLYHDYKEGSVKRNDTRALIEEGLSAISDATGKLLLSNPNQYALAYASEIVNLPTGSSRQHLIDEEVPFEQLVLSGSVRYASDAMNFTGAEEGLLKALETGSMLHYEGYYRDSSLVKGTALSHLCSGSLELFADRLAGQYRELSAAREATAGSALYAHQKLADDIYAAVYENGVRILVNYGDADYPLENGGVVPAGGYLIEREEM